jgi:hypothetical protein
MPPASTDTVRRPFGVDELAAALDADNDHQLAGAVGVTRRTISRWRHRGGFTFNEADQVAIAAHLHPTIIWPHWDNEHTP